MSHCHIASLLEHVDLRQSIPFVLLSMSATTDYSGRFDGTKGKDLALLGAVEENGHGPPLSHGNQIVTGATATIGASYWVAKAENGVFCKQF